jgi:methylenetetrahydrofolate reductase (NADPH)
MTTIDTDPQNNHTFDKATSPLHANGMNGNGTENGNISNGHPSITEQTQTQSDTLPVFPMDSKTLAREIQKEGFIVKKGTTIISKMLKMIEEGKPFYSFEYFPPKTAEGVDNLYDRLDRMSQLEPLFMDLTWGAGGSTADLTLEISGNAQQMCSGEVMMHLTCTNMPKEAVRAALIKARELGIKNILALRGDPPKGSENFEVCENGFAYAVDLVRYIRSEFGNEFGIAVAGYPEGHIASKNIEEDLKYLKEKVDAGADFIITQLFYDIDIFLQWVKRCREVGITCPIIPGIMPIQNYTGFRRMTAFCKTSVPQHIIDAIEPIQNDDARIKEFGIELGITMCKRLLAAGIPVYTSIH